MRAGVAALGPEPRPVLECLTVELVTAGPAYHDEGMVWLAYLARAVVVPKLAAELRGMYEPGERGITDALRGAADPGLDPELAALSLICLVDGLTAHVLLDRVDHATALCALRAQLDRLLPS